MLIITDTGTISYDMLRDDMILIDMYMICACYAI